MRFAAFSLALITAFTPVYAQDGGDSPLSYDIIIVNGHIIDGM